MTILTLILIRKRNLFGQASSYCKKIAEESVVLLKMRTAHYRYLRNKSILIVGPLSDAPHDQLGTWTMDGETERTQTPVKALREMYGDKVEIHFVKGLEYSRDKIR